MSQERSSASLRWSSLWDNWWSLVTWKSQKRTGTHWFSKLKRDRSWENKERCLLWQFTLRAARQMGRVSLSLGKEHSEACAKLSPSSARSGHSRESGQFMVTRSVLGLTSEFSSAKASTFTLYTRCLFLSRMNISGSIIGTARKRNGSRTPAPFKSLWLSEEALSWVTVEWKTCLSTASWCVHTKVSLKATLENLKSDRYYD